MLEVLEGTPVSPEKARKAARLASSAEKKLNMLAGFALVSVNVEVALPVEGIVVGMKPWPALQFGVEQGTMVELAAFQK